MSGTSGAPVTVVYTDGACQGNPGPGGWAWAVPGGRWRSGAERRSTNQRMEINAALDAARSLDGPLEIVSDSTYVVNCFQKDWWKKWVVNGWVSTSRQPVANRDLWEPLVDIYRGEPGRIRFRWVKGHSTDPYNDLVDRLAVAAAANQVGGEGEAPPARAELGAADAPSPFVRGRARAVEPGTPTERAGLAAPREERGRARAGGGATRGRPGDERGGSAHRESPGLAGTGGGAELAGTGGSPGLAGTGEGPGGSGPEEQHADQHADQGSHFERRVSGPAMERMALAKLVDRTLPRATGTQLGLLGPEPAGVDPGRVGPGRVGPGGAEPASVEPASVEPASVEPGGAARAEEAGVILRQAKPGDEAAVVELCVAAGVAAGQRDRLRLSELISRQPWALLVAESTQPATGLVGDGTGDAALVGAPAAATGTAMAPAFTVESASTIGAAVVVFDGWRGNVYVLAVHPAWRGRGVPALLVEEAEHRLASEGASQVTVQFSRRGGSAAVPWAPAGYRKSEDEAYEKDLTAGPGSFGTD